MATNISPLALAGHVQRQAELGRQQGDERFVRRMTPQVIAGDPNAFAQVAAVNPAAAAAGQAVGDDQLARAKGLIDFLEKADAADPAQAQALWVQHGVPYVRQFANGTEPTQDWQQAKGMLSGLKAKIAQAEAARAARGGIGGEPTGFRELRMKVESAGYKPGTPEFENAFRVALGTEGRAATGGFSFEMMTGADGVERPARRNPRTGQLDVFDGRAWVPLGTGANLNTGGPTPTTTIESNGRPVTIDADTDPTTRAAILANPDAFGAATDGDTLNVTQAAQAAPGAASVLGQGRRPEEQAYATEAARQAAQTAALAEQERIKADAAINQANAIAQGKVDVETDATLAKNARNAAQSLGWLAEARRILPNATGGYAESLGARAAAAAGISTPGAQATAQLKLLAAKLVANVPRFEGPQSNIDVQFYREAAGDLANDQLPVETRMAALETMVRLAEKAVTQQGGGGSTATPPAAPRRAVNPQTGETLILVNGAWVPEQ